MHEVAKAEVVLVVFYVYRNKEANKRTRARMHA